MIHEHIRFGYHFTCFENMERIITMNEIGQTGKTEQFF